MRRFNAILAMGIVVLFFIHAITGAFSIAGISHGGGAWFSYLAIIMVILIALHAVIGIKLTIDSLIACKRAGTSYFKENKLFWARRISGFAIMILVIFHITIFSGSTQSGAFRLNYFGIAELTAQILMVISIAFHVITNVKPHMVALGSKNLKKYTADILIVISIVLLFIIVAFIIYFLRWML